MNARFPAHLLELTPGLAVPKAWRIALPPLSLLSSVVMATTAGQATQTLFPALMPLLIIHYWGMRGVRALPVWFVFASGLVVDAYAYGALGQWALIALAAQQIAHLGSTGIGGGPLRRGFMALLALMTTLIVATGLHTLMAVSFGVAPLPITDAAISISCALLTYPFIAVLLTLATPRLADITAAPKRFFFGRRRLVIGGEMLIARRVFR